MDVTAMDMDAGMGKGVVYMELNQGDSASGKEFVS